MHMLMCNSPPTYIMLFFPIRNTHPTGMIENLAQCDPFAPAKAVSWLNIDWSIVQLMGHGDLRCTANIPQVMPLYIYPQVTWNVMMDRWKPTRRKTNTVRPRGLLWALLCRSGLKLLAAGCRHLLPFFHKSISESKNDVGWEGPGLQLMIRFG